MKRFVWTALVVLGGALTSGCSDDGKKSNPRPADGSIPDPNVKPDGVKNNKPQSNASQSVTKGD